MDLDEQLAALAAGELDDDTARALRARAATDPAIARRLARHRQLQRLLEGWEASAMSDEAVARLDARIDEALAALDDRPLSNERVVGLPPQPSADASGEDAPVGDIPASGDRQVADLDEARRRRGLPSWLPGAAVAAALVAVVGTGIVIGGLPGGADLDTIAEDSAEEATDGPVEEEAADAAADAEVYDDSSAWVQDDSGGPTRRSELEVPEGELLALVDAALPEAIQSHSSALSGDGADTTDDPADEDGDASVEAQQPAAVTAAPADAQCVTEALERDTEQADGREVWLVGTGTYAEEPAVFVVIRTPATPEDRFDVLAYDPAGCALLARDATG